MTQFSHVKLARFSAVAIGLFVASTIRAQTLPSALLTSPAFITSLLPEAPLPQAEPANSAPGSAQLPSQTQSSAPNPLPPEPSSTPAGPASPAPGTSPAQGKAQEHAEAERELQQQEKQRLLGVVPQFNVVMGGQGVALTPGEKWRLALHSAIDPFYIGYAFVSSGYSELAATHTGFGWGPSGYFKRVGATYADNLNGAIIGNALLPSILHQDPRYFRKGTGTKKSRFIYAALSTVICRSDSGKRQFNYSNVIGNYISGAISNAYYPANERGVGLTLENGTEVTLFGAVGGQLLEFAPDIVQHFKKKRDPPLAPNATP